MSKSSKSPAKNPASGGQHTLPGSERPRPPTHKLVAPVGADEVIGVSLVVRPRPGSPPLPDLQHWQSTPLAKRRYLTPDEYARTHGASEEDMAAAADFARTHGLEVLESHAGRRTLAVRGTAAKLNAAFGVVLQNFEAPVPTAPRGRIAHAPAAAHKPRVETHVHHGFDGPVTLPAELAGRVLAVIGLDDRRLSVPAGGTGDPINSNLLEVPTAAGYYNFPNTGAKDQTIGVHAPNPAAYLQNDITANYFPGLTDKNYRTAPTAFNDISLTVGGTTYSNNASSVQAITSATPNATLNVLPDSFIIELTQDVSTSATIAQGATMNVYFTADSEQGWLVFLNRVLLPEGEPQPTAITSSFPLTLDDGSGSIGSLSSSGSTASQMTALFQSLAALGIECFMGLGDWGSDDNVVDGSIHVSYPGSDPYITSCGGTVLGNVQAGPPLTFSEQVWSDAHSSSGFGNASSNFGTTGGGVSATFPAPPYQTAAGITGAKDSGGTFHAGRGLPDVAAMVGYLGFFVNGVGYNFVGTSCVAPLYAGLSAVLRSAFGRSLGPYNTTLYQLKDVAFNDITKGNNDSVDSPDSPYFTAGAGWDACSGLGSIDGTKLLNGIAGLLYNPAWYFQVNKGSYGLNEVGITSTYAQSLWLVLEGYTPDAVKAASLTPTVTVPLGGLTVSVGAAQPELPNSPSTPQRILFPCTVKFAASAIKTVASGGIFPAPGGAATQIPISSIINFASQLLTAETVFDLEPGADPYFSNFDTSGGSVDGQGGNAFWLSQDLRVFTVTPGVNAAPIDGVIKLNVPDNTNYHTSQAYTYITALLGHLNSAFSDPSKTDPFTLFPDQSNALSGDSSVAPTTIDPSNPGGPPFTNYNFAVARVRMSGAPHSSSGPNVKVFFRLFAAETSDTDYQPSLTYPSTFVGGLPEAPLLGVDNVTIPFFATGNYESAPVNTDYSANSINNQPIDLGAGNSIWVYYGCYLNIYAPDSTIGGKPLQTLLPSSHSCVVAQIAYDNAPIPTSGQVVGPENSDKLAQRNLQITFSDNPGPPSAHRVPQTFDLRPSAALGSGGDLLSYPDELMIDWGKTPPGSTATIYWPAVKSTDVLSLAQQIYSTHQLSAADPNTVQCTVPDGFTFVPIPPGIGQNFAGLFTVDLPQGVKAGTVYTITVRRLSTWRAPVAPPPPPPPPQPKIELEEREPGTTMTNWRYVVGTFAVRIPVTTAAKMRPEVENTLAIMKWRLEQMSSTNRWHPVLERYIEYLGGVVKGTGGTPGTLKASQWGIYGTPGSPPKKGPGSGPPEPGRPGRGHGSECHHEDLREHTGKVAGLIFDRFGDFEGFLLDTLEYERRFLSREEEMEELAERAWRERLRISVFVKEDEPWRPLSVIVRQPPDPFRP